ncbi:GEVED domain-containing protein [Neorhodopirellula pilleata]|nr:GEVED domain-containing protein [Neorhodopirellula pilleata]
MLACGVEVIPDNHPGLTGEFSARIDAETDSLILKFENAEDAEGIKVFGTGLTSAEGHRVGNFDLDFVQDTTRVDLTSELKPSPVAAGNAEFRIRDISAKVLAAYTPIPIPIDRVIQPRPQGFGAVEITQLAERAAPGVEIEFAEGPAVLVFRNNNDLDVQLSGTPVQVVAGNGTLLDGTQIRFGEEFTVGIDLCNVAGREFFGDVSRPGGFRSERFSVDGITSTYNDFEFLRFEQVEFLPLLSVFSIDTNHLLLMPVGISADDIAQGVHKQRLRDAGNLFNVDELPLFLSVNYGDGTTEVIPFELGMNLQATLRHVYTEPGEFNVSVQVVREFLDRFVSFLDIRFDEKVVVIQEGTEDPDAPFVGVNGLFEIDKFDVVTDGKSDNNTISGGVRIGAVHGRLAGGVTGDVKIGTRVQSFIGAKTGNLIDARNFFDAIAVVDVQNAAGAPRQSFSFDLEDAIAAGDLGGFFDPSVFVPAGIKHPETRLTFLLLDSTGTEVLDEIRLLLDDVEALFVESSERLAQPVDVDIRTQAEVLHPTGDPTQPFDPLTVFVTAENILFNLGPTDDPATLTIDFGDGTPLVVQSIVPKRSKDGGSLNDGIFAEVPDSFTAELSRQFTHQYTQIGEYIVRATLTLPNGQQSAEERKVSVGPLNPPSFSVSSVFTDRIHTAPGVAKLRVSGSVASAQIGEEVSLSFQIGDRTQRITTILDGKGYDVELDQIDLLELIPEGTREIALKGLVSVSGQTIGDGVFPFQFKVERQQIELGSFSRSLGGDPDDPLGGFADDDNLTFFGIGDEFDISVPIALLRGPFGNRQTVQDTGTFTFVATNRNMHSVSDIASLASAAVGGGLFDAPRMLKEGVITIKSFLIDPNTNGRTQIDEKSFSIPDLLLAPKLSLTATPVIEGAVNLGGIGGTLFNMVGDLTVTIDWGNGEPPTLLQRTGAFSGNPPSFNTQQVPHQYFDDPAGPESGQTFRAVVVVTEGGNEIARESIDVPVSDRGPAGLHLDVTVTSAALDPVSQREAVLEITGSDTLENGNPSLDDLKATVLWRDGTTNIFVIPQGGGTVTARHTYDQQFLEDLAANGSELRVARPAVTLDDDDGSQITELVNILGSPKMSIRFQDDPALLRAEWKDRFGPELAAGKAFVGEQVDVVIALTEADRRRVDALSADDEFIINVELGDGQTLELVGRRVSGTALREEFHVRNADGTLGSRLTYNDVNGQIELEDSATRESLVRYDRAGVFRVRAFASTVQAQGDLVPMAAAFVAIYPRVEVVLGDDGSVTIKTQVGNVDAKPALKLGIPGEDIGIEDAVGFVGFSDLDRFRAPSDPRRDISAGIIRFEQGELPFDVAVGGELQISLEVSREETASGGVIGSQLVLPFIFGAGQIRPIQVIASATIDQNVPVPLSLILSDVDREIVNSLPSDPFADGGTFIITLSLGDGTPTVLLARRPITPPNTFEVHAFPEDIRFGLGLFDRNTGRERPLSDELVAYDTVTGTLRLDRLTNETPFVVYKRGGLFEISAITPEAFGNAFISVSDLAPSVVPGFEQDSSGRFTNTQFNLHFTNGGRVKIRDEEREVPAGQSLVSLDEFNILPGEAFLIEIEEFRKGILRKLEIVAPSAPDLETKIENLTARSTDDNQVKVTGKLPGESRDVMMTATDSLGNVLGQSTIVAGQGVFEFHILRPTNAGDDFLFLELNNGEAISHVSTEIRNNINIDVQKNQTTNESQERNLEIRLDILQPEIELLNVLVETLAGQLAAQTSGGEVVGSNLQFNGTVEEVRQFLESVVFRPVPGELKKAFVDIIVEDRIDPTDLDAARIELTVATAPARTRDFGDAPAPFPTTLAADGARHIATGPMLGQAVDTEADGVKSDDADGDDTSGATPDDEDGVAFGSTLLAISDFATTANVLITASERAKLDAWIDFNGNGNWDDAGEQIFASHDVEAGENTLSFTVPASSSVGQTAARFRISTAGGLLPTGQADDGEVEDYLVTIVDGDTAADVSVHLPGGETSVTIEIPDEPAEGESPTNATLVVRTGTQELLRVPPVSVASIRLIASPQDDIVSLMDLSAIVGRALTVLADGGDGNDTLRLLGANFAVDLTGDGGTNLQNFEAFDIIGDGNNSLKLDADQVLRLSPASSTLLVRSNPGDRVEIGEGWGRIATEVVDGEFVRVVSQQAATLRLIGPDEWSNPVDPHDVNNDGSVNAVDALTVINELNRQRFSDNEGLLVPASTTGPFPNVFFDVTGDARASALDALRVINFLNLRDFENPAGENLSKRTSPTSLIAIAIANHSIGQSPPRSNREFDGTILPGGQSNQKIVAELLTDDRTGSKAMVGMQKEREILVDAVLQQMDEPPLPEQIASLELRNNF